MGFSSDIAAFRDKALQAASTNTMTIAQEVGRMEVAFSPSPINPGPYATGLLINQYYPSVGAPDFTVTTATNSSGADSLARINALAETNAFLGKDNVVYITNSTEEAYYADKLGWQKGLGTNGWIWKGAAAYYMRDQAITYIQQAYT